MVHDGCPDAEVEEKKKKPGMGQLGAIESLTDLPPRRKLVGS